MASAWQKNSHSGSAAQECVEVARAEDRVVALRDSKDPDGPMIVVGGAQWRALLTSLKDR
ncbi:DUF397 domain-containing protein [Actinomadura barringtoniae]|uniref:DUF397 domain-containing protein n=1 Tax=Actinomadura barringtoniae TaxID=1427535 RepID=A0A939PMV6_9ACTN|nr:DUF397 domain-containing protein [Actinomadura barringtoniae]MBO2452819.1 DUF397 domain-containing protein [Actinomadura barringtoniae]